VQALAFLLGTWTGEGKGEYPTIDSFSYGEEVRFWHVGKPFVAYSQRTWALDDRRPLHAEMGYWRGLPDGSIELILAHPTGVAELATGVVRATSLEVTSTATARTASAKEVTALTRHITVEGDTMRYRVEMAAVGQPLQHHLAAELHRQ
jgi:hypothetical protein